MRWNTLKARSGILAGAVTNRAGGRDHALRLLAFRLARRVTPFVAVDAGDLRYVVSTDDTAGAGIAAFVHGDFEADTMRRTVAALAEHAGIDSLRGRNVLEVGANIGTETVSLVVRHGAARVVAIEPDVSNVSLLRANVELNGLREFVEVHHLALSDTDGTLELELSDDNWGDHRIRVERPSGPSVVGEDRRATASVATRRLDTLVASGEIDLHAIDVVWMDVQGHEGHVLAGAERLLESDIPVMTEYWPYGLRRAGGLDRFHALVARSFSLAVDLRPSPGAPPRVLPAADLAGLAEAYATDAFAEHTNVLLVP